MLSTISLISAGLAVLYVILRAMLAFTSDPREPPVLETSIPFLGPIIRIVLEKSLFYPRLRDRYNLPIYTLRMPFARVYVVNATELIPVLQKHWRTVSFTPILASTGPGPMGMSKEADELLHRDMMSDTSPVAALSRAIGRALAPGEGLDRLNGRAVEVMLEHMDKLRPDSGDAEKSVAPGGEGAVIDFWAWANHVSLRATTDAVYGRGNPFKEQVFEDAWNHWAPRYMSFALSPFKPFLAAKTFRVREFMVDSWARYFREGWLDHASPYARAMYGQHKADGMSADDLARAQVGHSFGMISTTGPATWWMLYHIFSDEAVLNDVRSELEVLVEEDEKRGQRKIALEDIRTKCPILLSTFKETIRYRSLGTQVRLCLEDQLIDGRYLLKKGGIVMIPQLVQHTSVDAWGSDVHEFDHRRFVKGHTSAGHRKNINLTAFRAFGGGHTICPGRHFSSTEIIAFAALVVLQFDIEPIGAGGDGVGRWEEPTWANSPMVSTFHIPDKDFKVFVKPRDARKWKVDFVKETGEPRMATAITKEDMDIN